MFKLNAVARIELQLQAKQRGLTCSLKYYLGYILLNKTEDACTCACV